MAFGDGLPLAPSVEIDDQRLISGNLESRAGARESGHGARVYPTSSDANGKQNDKYMP